MKPTSSVVLVVLVTALLSLGFGVVMLDHGINVLGDPRITCGGHVMKPGDTCTTLDPEDDSRTKDDYQGMKNNRAVEGYVFTIAGVVVTASGVAELLALVFARQRITSWVESLRARSASADD
jgi:hypothetical protein